MLKDCDAIISLVDKRKHTISIITNGTLLSENRVKELKALGVTSIAVSLDSGIAEEHDAFRGREGVFNQAVQGVEYALRYHIHVAINTTVTPAYLRSEGFKKLLKFSKDKKIRLNAIFGSPSGRWAGNDDVIMSKADVQDFYETVKDNPYVVRDIDSGLTKGCPAGVEALYIGPYGDVLPCPFIQIRAGNVLESSLKEIYEKAKIYYHKQEFCMLNESQAFRKEYSDIISGQELPLSEVYLEEIKSWDIAD